MHFCMPGALKQNSPITSWEDIRLFLAVARGGSLSAGARLLKTDQSTVSRRLAALEDGLGRLLFERTSRNVRMTPHADALLPWAERVEEAVRAMEDGVRSTEDEVRGRVRIALTEGLAQHVVVPRVLPMLMEKHPQLQLELVTGDDVKDLTQHEADIALRFFQTPKGELVGRRVATLELGVLAAKSQAKKLAGVAARELPWVSYVRDFEVPEARWLEALGVTQTRLQCSSVEAQLAAVRAGLGVALAPRAMATVNPGLVALEPKGMPPLPRLEVFVVTRSAIRNVPRIAAVFDALVSALSELDRRAPAQRNRRN